jgi:hypothetical protein
MSTTTQQTIEFTRVNNDVNGNPRYVCHFMALLNANERGYIYDGEMLDNSKPILELSISEKYILALKKAKKIGGRKFHNKQYGGGIVFQSYNIKETEQQIKDLLK